MSDDITPSEIKRIRKKYGLTQQAFARLLGIGEASMVRYENGQPPSKANANLIRAAAHTAFMRECLERDGESIPPAHGWLSGLWQPGQPCVHPCTNTAKRSPGPSTMESGAVPKRRIVLGAVISSLACTRGAHNNRTGWRSKSARPPVVPEIVGMAEAKRTSVREPSASPRDRVPGEAAASAASVGWQADGTLYTVPSGQ